MSMATCPLPIDHWPAQYIRITTRSTSTTSTSTSTKIRSSLKIKISLRRASLRTLRPSHATEYTSAGCAARSARRFEAGCVASSPLLFFFFSSLARQLQVTDRWEEKGWLHCVQLVD